MVLIFLCVFGFISSTEFSKCYCGWYFKGQTYIINVEAIYNLLKILQLVYSTLMQRCRCLYSYTKDFWRRQITISPVISNCLWSMNIWKKKTKHKWTEDQNNFCTVICSATCLLVTWHLNIWTQKLSSWVLSHGKKKFTSDASKTAVRVKFARLWKFCTNSAKK